MDSSLWPFAPSLASPDWRRPSAPWWQPGYSPQLPDTASAAAASDVVDRGRAPGDGLGGRPDFSALDAATAAVAAGLTVGTLVSYEYNVASQTTRRRLAPALGTGSGLRPGARFQRCAIAQSGYPADGFSLTCGATRNWWAASTPLAARTRRHSTSVLDFDERPDLPRPNGVWDLGSAEAAELTKLAETTYRDVNIALANEFARFARAAGLDVYQVIEAANSQPFSHIHRPGISVGGHCIPVYPRLYLAGDPGARLPAVAREINEAVPGEAVRRLADLAGGLAGLRVAVLGAAYRDGVKETAFSGVFATVSELIAACCNSHLCMTRFTAVRTPATRPRTISPGRAMRRGDRAHRPSGVFHAHAYRPARGPRTRGWARDHRFPVVGATTAECPGGR